MRQLFFSIILIIAAVVCKAEDGSRLWLRHEAGNNVTNVTVETGLKKTSALKIAVEPCSELSTRRTPPLPSVWVRTGQRQLINQNLMLMNPLAEVAELKKMEMLSTLLKLLPLSTYKTLSVLFFISI